MIKSVIYNTSHLDLMDLTDDQESKEELRINTKNYQDAYTILIDGIPVFSIGAYLLNEQTANVWIVKTTYTEKYKTEIVKTIKLLIENFFKLYKLERMQTLILNEKFKKWIEFLGFELESELVGFSKEKTYMYRRLK